MDGPVGILRVDIYEHDLGAYVLDLPQNGISGGNRKSYMTKYVAADLGQFQSLLKRRQALLFVGQKGNRYAVHGRGLKFPTLTEWYEDLDITPSDFCNRSRNPQTLSLLDLWRTRIDDTDG